MQELDLGTNSVGDLINEPDGPTPPQGTFPTSGNITWTSDLASEFMLRDWAALDADSV